jgi:hypothetical protein
MDNVIKTLEKTMVSLKLLLEKARKELEASKGGRFLSLFYFLFISLFIFIRSFFLLLI